MNRLLLTLVCLLSGTASLIAQERADSLFYLDGKIETVLIIKNYTKTIDCNYIGENFISSIDKSLLHRIVFRSGRVEVCNEYTVSNDAKYDKLHFSNGDIIDAKVMKVSDDSIDYVLPNEELLITTYKTLLYKIVFSSGRVEQFGGLLNIKRITSKDQWEDVVVTYNVADTRGLEKVAEISKASGWGGKLASGIGYNDAIKLCQKEAAKLQCGLILINGSPNSLNVHYGAGVRVNVTAYRLPKLDQQKEDIDTNKNEDVFSLYDIYDKNAVIVELSADAKHGKAIRTFYQVRTHREALKMCQNLGEGWRLPTETELSHIFLNYENINKTLYHLSHELLHKSAAYWLSCSDPTTLSPTTSKKQQKKNNSISSFIAIKEF